MVRVRVRGAVGGSGSGVLPARYPTCRCRISPLQRQPSSLWMQRMAKLSTWASSSGSG